MPSVFSWIEAIQLSTLKPTTRHVLLNLASYMDKHGKSCFPSIDEQAKTTGLSKKAIIDHVNHAIEAGFLVKRLHRYAGQQWRRSEYFAVYPKSATLKHEDHYSENYEEIIPSEGGERRTPSPQKGGERHSKGGEPKGEKVVYDVHSNYPLNYPENKPVKIYKKTSLVTLEQWEEKIGAQLNATMLASWCREKGLFHPTITRLIEEFRIEMMGKGKQYADFKSAFQTYLTKGYLSLTLIGAQNLCKRESQAMAGTTINRRGGDL